MNYEEIIERLLEEKHITAKEAVYLLKQCGAPQYIPYWIETPSTTRPIYTEYPKITCTV